MRKREHVTGRLATILLTVLLLAGCTPDRPGPESEQAASDTAPGGSRSPPETVDGPSWFTDVAQDVGLSFTHFNGMSGKMYMPEILPPGCGLFDYDGDGDLDVFLVQGQMLGSDRMDADAPFPSPGSHPLGSRLYRNELRVEADGSHTLQFTDVTIQSGIEVHGYGMGMATGDVNNDGCVDLYITSFDRNQLFQNNCDGTFTDISDRSGTADEGWAVSASFVDYDQDGWLDLFVGNYLRYTLDVDAECHNLAGGRDYCTPQLFRAAPDRLLRNQGDGTFIDVSAVALVGGEFGPALGVTTADFDEDGWLDIYVANDGVENQLWTNQRDGTFRDTALLSGVAMSKDGNAEGSMGVDASDFDNDGDEDLFMTHLPVEGNNLYVNDRGTGLFEDRSGPSGLGGASRGYTGFGTAWFDFDNDGWLDVFTANGGIVALAGREQDPFPYGERNLLFRNLRDGRFEDVSDRAGPVFELSDVSRGVAFGDIDNDGDIDILVGNNNGPVRLLVNNIGNRNHWLGLRLVGEHTSRDMLGARVRIVRTGHPTLTRRVRADASYASANDPRLVVGLGDSQAAPSVSVRWPGGRLEEWTDVAIDRWTTLTEGGGQ